MESLKELFKVGYGPSSSHTLGPQRAAIQFKNKYPNAKKFKIFLYGSLALTGKGHKTDFVLQKTLEPIETEIIFESKIFLDFHPNGMKFEAYDNDNIIIDKPWTVFSTGGGTITDRTTKIKEIYKENNLSEIIAWCDKYNKEIWEYVVKREGVEILDYLFHIWQTMDNAIENGLSKSGRLPGPIFYPRKARKYLKKRKLLSSNFSGYPLVYAYSLAVAEENAAGIKGSMVVTSPTCGASGVIPGAFRTIKEIHNISEREIINALAVAGVFGIVTKKNASISGAEVGCQGEVGVACSMAAAGIAYMLGGSVNEIEYAAEVAMEHHLGMTCDPVAGAVQIPCIERNAMGAVRAIDSAIYALISTTEHRVDFDSIIEVMYQTGKDLQSSYKETSIEGLAKTWRLGSLRKDIL